MGYDSSIEKVLEIRESMTLFRKFFSPGNALSLPETILGNVRHGVRLSAARRAASLANLSCPPHRSLHMPHDYYADEVADPQMTVKELRGVIRRQRVLLIISLIANIAMLLKDYKRC